MTGILTTLSELISNNMWLAPVLALIAGIFTSITPCALSSVPLIIGYVGSGSEKSTKNSFKYSIAFAVGLSITFTILGVIAATAGSFFGNYNSVWMIFLGVLMILMAFQTAEIFNFLPQNDLMSLNKKKGMLGALFLGILGGIFSSPCSTPVLILLMGIIGTKGNLIFGIILMLFYSVGYSALTIVAGTSVGFVRRLKQSSKYGRWAKFLKYFLAVLMLLLGLYLLYQGL